MKEVINPDLAAYQQERLAAFIKDNQKRQTAEIVVVGDSIVEFFSLKKYISREYDLVNRGIAGTDSLWLEQHLDAQLLSLKPQKAFIWIGTNDLGRGFAVPDVLNRFADILGKIKANSLETEIFILSVLPVNEGEDYKSKVKIRRNKAIKVLNSQLRVLAGAEFIDLYDLLLDETGNLAPAYTTDGLHLTQSAYSLIGEKLRTYL
ncbi:SGNH/GDSL hydrolase family protein [Streptococcus dentiloxodontae]